jgi:hypothetical protein
MRACAISPRRTTKPRPRSPTRIIAAPSNMTDMIAGAGRAQPHEFGQARRGVRAFPRPLPPDPLVLDKWLSAAGEFAAAGNGRGRARADEASRLRHEESQPRALAGRRLRGNHLRFHGADGAGYALVAETIRALDAINPQVAARMSGAFENWRRYDSGRQALMRAELEAIAKMPGFPRICSRSRARCWGSRANPHPKSLRDFDLPARGRRRNGDRPCPPDSQIRIIGRRESLEGCAGFMAQSRAFTGPVDALAAPVQKSARAGTRHIRIVVIISLLLIAGSFASAGAIQMRLDRMHAMTQAAAFDDRRAQEIATDLSSILDRYEALGTAFANAAPSAETSAALSEAGGRGLRNIAVLDGDGQPAVRDDRLAGRTAAAAAPMRSLRRRARDHSLRRRPHDGARLPRGRSTSWRCRSIRRSTAAAGQHGRFARRHTERKGRGAGRRLERRAGHGAACARRWPSAARIVDALPGARG